MRSFYKDTENIQIDVRTLSLKAAAEYLSISHWTLRKLIWNGEIPSIRVGRKILIDKKDLNAWVDWNKTTVQ